MPQNIVMPSIYAIACHTDYIGNGSTFVAIKGMKDDGVHHILRALEKGASTVVVEKSSQLTSDIHQAIANHNAQLVYVDNARAALAQLSAQAAGYPARRLRIVGVTGTKGKTTSSFLIEHVLRSAGCNTALLSTVHNSIRGTILPTNLTTQHPDYLHNFFALCLEHGVDTVVMEVAAQATSLHRVDGIEFDGLIFTNFAQEHGEFYATMEEYFAAKVAILDQLKANAPLLLNGDDEQVSKLSQRFNNAQLFGIKNVSSRHKATIVDNGLASLKVVVATDGLQAWNLESVALLGDYNAYNILGVAALCLNLGIDFQVIAHAIKTFSHVPGRLERYQLPNGASCFIDYAHNPSSYQAVLSMVRSMSSQLIVVFGCGGDRDKSKRPLMGAIAATIADLVVLTADNPRSEKAEDIIQDILSGIDDVQRTKVLCEVDREKAIKRAYARSQAGAIIMLLGKGPDEYQLIGGHKFPFSEKAIVQSL